MLEAFPTQMRALTASPFLRLLPWTTMPQTSDILIPSSVARQSSDDDEDYEYYYGSM